MMKRQKDRTAELQNDRKTERQAKIMKPTSNCENISY